jgi:hypothetical protein
MSKSTLMMRWSGLQSVEVDGVVGDVGVRPKLKMTKTKEMVASSHRAGRDHHNHSTFQPKLLVLAHHSASDTTMVTTATVIVEEGVEGVAEAEADLLPTNTGNHNQYQLIFTTKHPHLHPPHKIRMEPRFPFYATTIPFHQLPISDLYYLSQSQPDLSL